MAKMGAVIDRWMGDMRLDATAIQCWTAMEEFFGIVPCTCMSMMSNDLRASACEVDITGALSMYALQLASQAPSALVDWNNNYGGDEDQCVLFHCGNFAKSFLPTARISTSPILGSIIGDDFGASMVALGDMDGGGLPDFAIGAPAPDQTGVNLPPFTHRCSP